jgi:hypothetical protein
VWITLRAAEPGCFAAQIAAESLERFRDWPSIGPT